MSQQEELREARLKVADSSIALGVVSNHPAATRIDARLIALATIARIAIDEQPTLRDQFAMAALDGIISEGHLNGDSLTPDVAASFAYEVADAMLAMRVK